MRTWISFPTSIRGIRLGAAVPLNTRPRIYAVSPTGLKVWRIGSALILAGLALWLIFSRDHEGRLNENFLLVIGGVLAARWLWPHKKSPGAEATGAYACRFFRPEKRRVFHHRRLHYC